MVLFRASLKENHEKGEAFSPSYQSWLGLQRRTRRVPGDSNTTHLEDANVQENVDLINELETTGGILL